MEKGVVRENGEPESTKGDGASQDLLYCEYVNSSEHVIEKLLHGKRKCPNFNFTKSSVLERVKGFLPELKKAQEDLLTKSPEEYSIEAVKEDEPVIEFNIGLVENPAKEISLLYEDCSESSSDDDDGDSEEGSVECSDSENKDNDEDSSKISERTPKRRRTCLIEVLSEQNTESCENSKQ